MKKVKCDNCGELVSNESQLAYCVECKSYVCACCIGDNYDDVCRDCEE